jgi:hypothetical protein
MPDTYVTRGGETRQVPSMPARRGVRLEGESYGASITRRNNEKLRAGVHPITGHPLLVGPGLQCATCDHLRVNQRAKRWYKCELNESHGPRTDVRVGWPACTSYVRSPDWPA